MISDASMEIFSLSTQTIDQPIFEEQGEDGSIIMRLDENQELN